jgi:hypothetical protein
LTKDVGSHAAAGGRARAQNLSPQSRSEIARQAAIARWGAGTVRATHDGSIIVGDRELTCAVLEDGTRVLNQQTMLTTLGRASKPKGRANPSEPSVLPPFLAAQNLQAYITAELASMVEPIPYRTPTGGKALGYNALILPAVCDVYLSARSDGKLLPNQALTAKTCEVLVRGLARVGVVALVDEATGYQESRARYELQQILNHYVQAELRPWTKRFPDEFFREIYRLQGWDYKPGTAKRTPYVGNLINKYIYEQLPHGVLEELRRLNPVTETGRRRHKHFQHLTADTGNVHLDRQISTVSTLLRIAEHKADFDYLFGRAFPPHQERLPLVLEAAEDDDGES